MNVLTKEDWIEIYYAVESKLKFVKSLEDDHQWEGHLQDILDKLGPDGTNMWE